MARPPRILALILAGGEGSRLGVLTRDRAKPALPYAGVYRLIDFSLSNCVHSGLSDVWVAEQYEAHSILDHLTNGRPWDLDRTYGGLRLLHPRLDDRGDGPSAEDGAESGWHRGNADAIFRNASLIRQFEPEVLLVLSADHAYTLDYREVIQAHLERDATVTMVTARAPDGDASRYGVVVVDGSGRIQDYLHKPDDPPGDLVAAEVFAFDPPALLDRLEELHDDEQDGDLGEAALPSLVREGRAFEHRLQGYWRDLGTIESYWTAHMDLVDGRGPRLDDPDWPILTHGLQHPPARVRSGAKVQDSLLSPGCHIGGRVVRSVVGPGVQVEEGAEITESVLLRGVRIEAGAVVVRAVVDEGSRLGSGARVHPSDRSVAVVPASTHVPDGVSWNAGRESPAASS